jgi:adenosylcobinamide-phosphate synthase
MDAIFFSFILPASFMLDLLMGDPPNLPHPVRWMGKAIEALEPVFRRLPISFGISGALLSIALVVGTWALVFWSKSLAYAFHPICALTFEIILIYYAISIKCLKKAAIEVMQTLKQEGLFKARQKVALIVGRDTENLSKAGVMRACVETVAENLVDGVIAPLFYAALGGAPLACAYKMINTMDSMIGHKNTAYRDFGRFAARLDDAANYIPARLSVPVIAFCAHILFGKGIPAFQTALHEGDRHPSPNAGYPEAAFAGALDVRLNGPSIYGGKLVDKPYIGVKLGEVNSDHIRKAVDLMVWSASVWVVIATVVSVSIRWLG